VPLLFPLLYELATPPLGERQGEVHRIVLMISAVVAAFFVVLLAFPAPVQHVVELLVRPWRKALPVEARLAEAAVRGARQRIQGTLAGLAVVVAAVFIVRSVNVGFLDESARFAATALDGRVYVQNREMTRAQAGEALGLPQVARIVPLSVEVKAPFDLRAIDAAIVRANAARAGLAPLVVEEFARGETLLLSTFLAREYGWRVGDAVTLPTYGGAKSLRVGAITDSIGYLPDDRSFALIESGRMDRDYCLDGTSARHWALELQDGADSGAVETELRRRLPPAPDLKVRSDRTVTSFYLSDGRRDFYVFDVDLWSTAALAAVGLLNSLAIALLERKREIGLLRTLGLTSRQVGNMLLVEALALGVVGGALATALAWPIGKLAVDAVRVISRLDLRFVPDTALLAGPFVTCVTFALLAALGPALHGGRLDLAPLHRND
jgi:putative ABC transport system permease protein